VLLPPLPPPRSSGELAITLMAARSGAQRSRAALRLVALAGVSALVLAPQLAQQLLGFVAGTPRAGPPCSRPAGRSRAPRTAVAADVLESAAEAVVDALDPRVEAKAKLLDLLEDETVAQEVLRPEGKPIRGQVDERILALERLNPSDEPAYSELLDGTWTVKYSGSYAPGLLSSPTRELALFLYGGGFSLGNALSSFAEGFWGQSLGLKLGEKTVTIRRGRDVDAAAELEVGGQMQKLAYTAELLPLSSRRLNEEVVSLDLPEPIGKRDTPFELRRSMIITYLDEEVMISRDESGVPEVLTREKPPAPVEPAASTTVTEPVTEEALADISEDPLSSDAS